MACLDIPIPRSVARLVREPPFCRPRIQDIQVLDLIREFGQKLARPSDEIEQALDLASGPSDVMIILERPRLKHPFSASFDAFVQDCDTLQAVNELIRFASNGTRSIHTVTVVDAYTFKPHLGNNTTMKLPTDEQCHKLLEQIVKLKAPQSLLCCWQDDTAATQCENAFVRKLMSAGVGTWPILDQVKLVAASRVSTLVRSFHPAYAVCYNEEQKAYARMLLVCHFVLAFASLSGSGVVPKWMHAICNGSYEELHDQRSEVQYRVTPKMSNAAHILAALRRMRGSTRPTVLDPRNTNSGQYNADINYLVTELLSSNYADGSLELARVCVRWRNYEHPRKDEIRTRLIDLGSKQEWFQSPDAKDYQSPAAVSYGVGFADDSDEVLANGLRSLEIDGTHLVGSSYDEEKKFWSNHESLFLSQKKQLERFDKLLVKLILMHKKTLELYDELWVMPLPDIDLRLRLDDVLHDASCAHGFRATALTNENYVLLQEAFASVIETPNLLRDRLGIHPGEGRPQRALVARSDARRVLRRVHSYLKPTFHLIILCLAHQSTLLNLCAASGATTNEDGNETVDTLDETSDQPRSMDKLISSLKSMVDLQKQLDSGET